MGKVYPLALIIDYMIACVFTIKTWDKGEGDGKISSFWTSHYIVQSLSMKRFIPLQLEFKRNSLRVTGSWALLPQ